MRVTINHTFLFLYRDLVKEKIRDLLLENNKYPLPEDEFKMVMAPYYEVLFNLEIILMTVDSREQKLLKESTK